MTTKTKIEEGFTFPATVNITVLGQEDPKGGTVRFRHKGRKATQAWIDSGKDRQDPDFIGEILVGWDDDFAEATGAGPYSAQALEDLLDRLHPAAQEIFDQYLQQLQESRVKNSWRPRG